MSITAIMLGVVSGLAFASIFVLIAISLTMILAASGVFNFAQGTIVMGGTILAYLLEVKLGWTALGAATSIIGVGILSGLLTHLIAVWPTVGRSRAFSHTTVLTTIGLGTAANAIILLLFGGDTFPVPSFISDSPISIAAIPLRPIYLVMIAAGIILTLGIDRLLRSTAIGHMFRATLEDPEGARLVGIDTRKIIGLAFAVAGGMAAIAGFLVAPVIDASAFTANDLAFYGFAGMAIGGFGSFVGALVGGIVVGLIYGVVPVILNPDFTSPLLWLVVVGVLLVKPSGLLGTAGLFGSARLREI
jgi:branched-subunit amino acid ABC-type transport system permease component